MSPYSGDQLRTRSPPLLRAVYVCQFRFFPPEISVLQDKVKERVRRGAEAEKINERLRRQTRLDILNIYKQWIDTFGVTTQVALGDVADLHEKFKNLILWRNPTATWRTLTLLNIATLFVAFAPPHLVFKTIFFFLGIVYFVLSPLAAHYPRYRRPLNPVWWALWGCPTDAQFAIKLLRERHFEQIQDVRERDALQTAMGVTIDAKEKGKSKDKGKSKGSGADTDGEELVGDARKPRKLGSFFCQNKGVPGFLHVTTEGIYFVGVHQKVGPGHSHKTCKTPFREITDLIKTKSLRLFVWSSAGLQIRRADGRSMFFSNMNHRNKAFNLILAVGSEGELTSDPPRGRAASLTRILSSSLEQGLEYYSHCCTMYVR